MTPPELGFPISEYRQRLSRAQRMMSQAGMEALLLTTDPNIRYFTGFLTRFWESPTRPWFLVVPVEGDPVAVIPTIGAHLMSQSWISDIRTWRSPDYDDDGVSILSETLAELTNPEAKIGTPSGIETHLRLPLDSWHSLLDRIGEREVIGDSDIIRRLRMVKSPLEVEKIRAACNIAGRAFDRVSEIAEAGVPLDQVFRRFQMLCLEEGADWVAYLAGGAGPGGYGDVISPATARPLTDGDVLMLDIGLVHDGYFCDFDRNFAIGEVTARADAGYASLLEATQAAFAQARPGSTAADLFRAMDSVLTGGTGGSEAGRYGHGLGMQLTEWPSIIPSDKTVLQPGMVLTLEPGIELRPGQILVHEEDIVITGDGAEFLSPLAPKRLPRLRAKA